jgi:hypothetical protein
MASIGISTGVRVQARRATLVDEFRLRNIPILSNRVASRHKRLMLEIDRLGVSKIQVISINFIRWFLWCTSLAVVPILLNRRHFLGITAMIMHVILVIGLMLVGVSEMIHLHFVVAGLLISPLLISIYIPYWTGQQFDSKASGAGYWYRKRLVPDEDGVTPFRLRERLANIRTIPGVRIYEEHFEKDPLLLAIRGYGPWKEVLYFGAYNTSDPSLDSF